jgi:hypothetical protein
MNVPQRLRIWNGENAKRDLGSLIKRGFCPIYVLTVRYDSPVKWPKARQQFLAIAFGLDFVGRMADRNAALASLKPVAIGTVDSPVAVSVMKIWIDMPISRFEAPHLRDIPGEIAAEFVRSKVEFRTAMDCGGKFDLSIRRAKTSDCYFVYPA